MTARVSTEYRLALCGHGDGIAADEGMKTYAGERPVSAMAEELAKVDWTDAFSAILGEE